jgi:hypothetical protein
MESMIWIPVGRYDIDSRTDKAYRKLVMILCGICENHDKYCRGCEHHGMPAAWDDRRMRCAFA